MKRNRKIAQVLFALGIVSVGILTFVYGYDILLFLPAPPAWTSWLKVVGYASAVLLVGTGAGLLFDGTARISIRILLPFLLLWTLSRVPVVFLDPMREISWFAIGEVGVLAAAGIVLFTWLVELPPGSPLQLAVSKHALTVARILFGLSVVTYGLSHFFEFHARTITLVPAWLPFREGWADLAGAGQVAAGLGATFSVLPRLAAASEASMMSVFTVLVWIPAVITNPKLPSNWSEFLVTFAIAGASWVMADALGPSGAGQSHESRIPA